MILKLFVVLSLVKMTSCLQYYFDTSKGPVCFHDPVDIAIAIDSSISIGSQQNFDQGIEYIKKFLDEFYFNDTHRFTRVSAVMYGDRVYTESAFDFGTYNSKAEIINAISQFKWKHAANSDTASAIDYMIDRFFPQRAIIAGYTHVVFVLTNGRSENQTATAIAADRARGRGLLMIAVGVGPYYLGGQAPMKNGDVNAEELYSITGKFDNFATVEEVRKTKAIVGRIVRKLCID